MAIRQRESFPLIISYSYDKYLAGNIVKSVCVGCRYASHYKREESNVIAPFLGGTCSSQGILAFAKENYYMWDLNHFANSRSQFEARRAESIELKLIG